MNMNIKSESKIQQEIVMWYKNAFCLIHHNPRRMILSIPNEGSQGRIGNLQQTGLYSGAADLLVIHNTIIFVECKDDKGTQKPKQINFQQHCEQMGIDYHIVRSLQDFKDVILNL